MATELGLGQRTEAPAFLFTNGATSRCPGPPEETIYALAKNRTRWDSGSVKAERIVELQLLLDNLPIKQPLELTSQVIRLI